MDRGRSKSEEGLFLIDFLISFYATAFLMDTTVFLFLSVFNVLIYHFLLHVMSVDIGGMSMS